MTLKSAILKISENDRKKRIKNKDSTKTKITLYFAYSLYIIHIWLQALQYNLF
jgi:hypothetical protein